MQFEHIVQVNDLTDPSLPTLNRQQLWEGLVLRATAPDLFLPGLSDFSVEWLDDQQIKRTLSLPGIDVHDHVTLIEGEAVHYEITPTETLAGGSLTMRIEEPEPNALFVRFTYHARHLAQLGNDLPYDQFAQQAYVASDIDTISLIRLRHVPAASA